MIQALAVLLPVLYTVAALLFGMALGGVRAPQAIRSRRAVFALAVGAHVAWFVARARASGSFPVVDLWTSVSAVALSTALLFAIVARFAKHVGSGGFVLGFAALAQLLGSAFVPMAALPRATELGAPQIVHVVTSVVACAALVLSGLHGALYLVLLREMRERRFGRIFAGLPDLDVLARMTRGAALCGFLGLAIGLNFGIGLAHAEKSPGFGYTHPEVLVSLALWLYFGAVAFSSRIPGFGARRAALAAASGFVVLLLSVLLVFLPHPFHTSV